MNNNFFNFRTHISCFLFAGCFFILFSDKLLANEDFSFPLSSRTTEEIAKIVEREIKDLKGLPYEFFATVSVMQRVHANISSFSGGDYKKNKYYLNSKKASGEKAIHFLFGYCDDKTIACMLCLKHLNIKCRKVQFYNINGELRSHSTFEVFYDDEWHFFDPQCCLFFVDSDYKVLSFEDVSKLTEEDAKKAAIVNNASLENIVNPFFESKFCYIKFKYDLIIDDFGVINVDLARNNTLNHIPNYVGFTKNLNDMMSEKTMILKNIEHHSDEHKKIFVDILWTSGHLLRIVNPRNQKMKILPLPNDIIDKNLLYTFEIPLDDLELKENDEICIGVIPIDRNKAEYIVFKKFYTN